MSSRYISVFIPVFNGEEYLRECIDAILAQIMPLDYKLELMITDSGSSDRSVDIIRSYGDRVVFDQIPNSEYGHGKTRQRAAEKARGDYILFLSQDATPFNDSWLQNMLEPFFMSDRVGCVYGQQIPRRNAPPAIKREVQGVFGALGPSGSVVVQKPGSFVKGTIDGETNNFFSDVNSAIRKDLVNEVPFRDVRYAEDQALAQDMQRQGYLKAYVADGAVWHSNMYTATEYYSRKFDEYVGLIDTIGYVPNRSLITLLFGWIKPTIKDFLFALKDNTYSRREKIKFVASAPAYNINVRRGEYHAAIHGKSEAHIQKKSLESIRKNSK